MAKIENIHCTICTQPIFSSWQNALPPAFASLEQRGALSSLTLSVSDYLMMMMVMMMVMMMSSSSPRPLSNQIHNNSSSENQTFAIQALGLCTLCESNGEQYWEFPVFARSEDSQGSARIKASKGFSKLDLQNNSPTKSGQEDKVISIYIMMLVIYIL